ncbi:hypothetical protein H257_10973 [Aphanomyces astaci]|uniref:Reverse transcriptase domain-containing protein n=1 Tax=Aphanomyces astaci TaxID=112090 RepID=W4G3U1_APHAT|nr:hypothetical protein H257_10973 [Aphanomyces astaci]ETV74382.1 hypothetical protein H257_10973 [Aphanomyces astaci]|eukprot:XP_009836040.1 hypothetical protein H257_10973 [Aphanomyces astaci]
MSGLVAPETLPLPDDILTFTDHATGETHRTTLQHVIDFAFVIDGENTTESHRPLGSSYCDDPSLIRALHPNPVVQPTASVTTVSFPTGPPALPPYRRQLLQPSLHIDAFLQQELPSPLPSPLEAPCISLADDQAASQAQRVSRAAARSQRAVHRTLISPTLVHLPPMELTSRLSCDPWIGFTPHPGIFTYLYDLSFGSGSLSVAHFLPLTDHERRTWNDDAAVNPRNFSASVSPPRPRSLQSAQAILYALDTLDAFFLPSAYGSPTASQYFSCTKRFCTALNRRFPIAPLSVPVVVAWLDDQFHSFGSAIATDFQYARRPSVHTQSFTTFDIDGPASYQLQMSITQAYPVSQPTRTVHHKPTRHSNTTVQSDSIGQHSTAQHSRVGIPPAVRDNILTSDGKVAPSTIVTTDYIMGPPNPIDTTVHTHTRSTNCVASLSHTMYGQSVNSCTNKDKLSLVEWPKFLHVTRRINALRASLAPNTAIKGMIGDVVSAYRHLSASCTDTVWFGLAVPEAGVIGIDMSAPFGWCGSPNIYCAFGNGISWLVSRESRALLLPKMSSDHRPFWGFNYIDDHILIEQDIGHRLSCANNALRLAMMATLGPTSLNLQKFTPW